MRRLFPTRTCLLSCFPRHCASLLSRRAWAAAERQTRGAVIPRDWIDLAGRILAQWGETGAAPRIAVVGAKGAGKSTLARFLTNALLSHSHQVRYP